VRVALSRRFQFDAAHRNTKVSAGDPRARMAGHTCRLALTAAGVMNDHMGWLLDFGDLKDLGNAAVDKLDHRCLNDIDGLVSTTLPDLKRWFDRQVRHSDNDLMIESEVRIVRYPKPPEILRADGENTGVAFGFSAAHFLPRLPESHKCRRLHGHSFAVDAVTPHSEKAIRAIESFLPELDHRLLNEIKGLDNPTSEVLARWLWDRLLTAHINLREITVSETCTTECCYRGG